MEGYEQNLGGDSVENFKEFSQPIATLIKEEKATVIPVEDIEFINLSTLVSFASTAALILVSKVEKTAPEMMKEAHDMEPMNADLQKNIQGYINCFRLEIGNILQRDTGIKFDVVGFPEGTLIDMQYGPRMSNSDNFINVSSLKEAFAKVSKKPESYIDDANELKELKADINDNKFPFDEVGYFIGSGALLIKKNTKNAWTIEKAQEDVTFVMGALQGKNKL